MAIEPLYVLNTNALIWHLSNDRKLGRQARENLRCCRARTRHVS